MAHGKSPKHTRRPRKQRAGAASADGGKPKARAGAASRATARKKADTDSHQTRLALGPDALPIASSIRLQKLLANAGFGSRRQTEQFLRDERVTVNGRVAKLGDSADPRVDEIRVDGERLAREKPIYWIMNKPRGVVTTVRDEAGRKTVINLLPQGLGRVFPVGRLDRETSGLLLLTNDGDTTHALLHPSHGNEREYRVSVKGTIDDKAIARLEKGVSLEEGKTAPGQVDNVRFDSDKGTSNFSLTLVEGRKRQIRRSLLILGFPVRRLSRVRMGPLRLGRLPVGDARPLRAEERRALLDHVARLRGEDVRPRKSTARKPASSKPASKPSTRKKKTTSPPSGPRRGVAKKAARSQRKPTSRKGTRR